MEIIEARKKCIRLLLEKGCDINEKYGNDETALFIVSEDQKHRPQYFVDFLIQKGAKMPDWYDDWKHGTGEVAVLDDESQSTVGENQHEHEDDN